MNARGTDPQIPQCVDLTLCISSRENRGQVINVNIDTFFCFPDIKNKSRIRLYFV